MVEAVDDKAIDHGSRAPDRADDGAEQHYVLIIHGTFSAPRPGTRSWYQPPGIFVSRLQEYLSEVAPEMDGAVWRNYNVTQFSWSGKNDHAARMSAAYKFAELCKQLVESDRRARIHVVAHSHGGNILLQAIERLLDPVPEYYQERTFPEAFRWRFRNWPRLSRFLGLTRQNFREIRTGTVGHLGRLVFLGTPFLRKQWVDSRNPWVRLGRVPIKAFVAYVGSGLMCYLVAIVYAGLFAATPWVPFIGFNPFGWPVVIQTVAYLATLGLGTLTLFDEPRFNTNLYFAEHSRQGKRIAKPLESLVVSAEFLDEALLALAAEPLIETEVTPRIDEWIYPNFFRQVAEGWRSVRSRFCGKPQLHEAPGSPFERYRSISGWYSASLMDTIGSFGWVPVRLSLWIILLVLRVPGAFVRSIVRDKLVRLVTDTAVATIHGLPMEEVRGARIEVSSRIGIDTIFAERHWDLSQIALATRTVPSVNVDSARYTFLTDDTTLNTLRDAELRRDKELKEDGPMSLLKERLSDLYDRYVASAVLEPSLQERKLMTKDEFADRLARGWFVATERFREFNGSVDLFHGMYYSQPEVIKQIARFIGKGEVPQAPPSVAQ